MDISGSMEQESDDNNISLKDNELDEIKTENNEEKVDLRKGFYVKKNGTNKENNDSKDNKEITKETNNNNDNKNDDQDFDYLKNILVKKKSKINYEKIFDDVYEINENYDEEEERKKKYGSKKKIIRLKLIRPPEKANITDNNIQLNDNSNNDIGSSIINEKSFNKENYSPNKKNKIKEIDNITKKYSTIRHIISGEKNEIKENANLFDNNTINIKNKNIINILKKNTFKDNNLLGKKNPISSVEENQVNKESSINESFDKKNNIKENDTLNKRNSIKEDNFSDKKNNNNNDSDTHRKNSIVWFRNWLFLKLWKIKKNISNKRNRIKENLEKNKNKEENIETDKNNETNINKNESEHFNTSVKKISYIDKNKGNNKIDKTIGHYKNEKFYENELDKFKIKENNGKEKDKNIKDDKKIINKDNQKLKNISKNFPLTCSSSININPSKIKSNEYSSFFTNKNNNKTKSKISLGDKAFKKVEPKSRKDLITTKTAGEKAKIKKFINKGDNDYLNDNKKTKKKHEFNKLVNEFSKTRSQYQINNRSIGKNKNLNKTFIGKNQVKDNDKKGMKTIRISKEKRDKNGDRNVKNTLRKNSSHTKRLKSISQRNLDTSSFLKKKKNYNDGFSSKIILKKITKKNVNEKKSKIHNSSFYLRDKPSKIKNTINESNYKTTKHITALNAYTHLIRSRNENFRRNFNKNFLNQTAVYKNNLIEGNKEIKENNDNKKYILNDSFINYNNDSFTQRLKSSKDINKLQNKKQNKMPISIKHNYGYIISKKKTDISKMNKTFVK
jgi:hypothetical protein